jgi:hypothetical protein
VVITCTYDYNGGGCFYYKTLTSYGPEGTGTKLVINGVAGSGNHRRVLYGDGIILKGTCLLIFGIRMFGSGFTAPLPYAVPGGHGWDKFPLVQTTIASSS